LPRVGTARGVLFGVDEMHRRNGEARLRRLHRAAQAALDSARVSVAEGVSDGPCGGPGWLAIASRLTDDRNQAR
jgi:hypothetical protein